MSSAAEHRRPALSDGEAILNALPNPVLLVGPDGKIIDANMAAESFFEISTQFLQHHDDMAGTLRQRRDMQINLAIAPDARRAQIDLVFVDGRTGRAHLLDQG